VRIVDIVGGLARSNCGGQPNKKDQTMVAGVVSQRSSSNARAGALAFAVCTPLNLILHGVGPSVGPLSYAAWLGLSFGILCFCEEMGAARPLNRAGLVLFAAAFCADTLSMLSVDPFVIARSHLLYAFALLGAVVLWSVALMHRTEFARAVGAAGAAVGVGFIVLLVAAHLLLGAATIMGFSQLFRSLDGRGGSPFVSLAIIDSVFCVWALLTSALLWTARLRS
jgi:hypothetical protein